MIRKLKTRARNYFWKVLKAKWKLNSGIELIIENDNDWFVFNEIFTNKEYDDVFQLLPPGDINNPLVLDLGANVGYFALHMANEFLLREVRNFTLYSIEASSENYKQLNKRVSQLPLANRCRAIHGLVGYKQGSSFLSIQTDHFGYQLKKDNINGEKTDFIDIEDLLKDDNRRIALLKCDIEGSEEIFLAEYCSLLQRTDLAIFEFHAGDCNVSQCKEYITNAGLMYVKTVKNDDRYKTSVEIFKR